MKKFSVFCEKFVFYVFFTLMSYIVLANINKGSNLSVVFVFMVTVLSATVVFIFSLYKKQLKIKKLFFSVVTNKKWLAVVAVGGLVFRLLPFLAGFVWVLGEDTGDCAVHFSGSQQLAFDGQLSNRNASYESLHFQLYSYTVLLSLFVRIFKDMTVSVLISNILFDCISVFFLIRTIRIYRKTIGVGFVFWWLNPFFIVMCWLPMAIVVVNTFLMGALYFGMQLYKKFTKEEKGTLCAVLFGLSIFSGNLFRPMFYVLLIAEVIAIVVHVFAKPKKWKNALVFLVIILLSSVVPGKIYSETKTNIQGYEVPENRLGWNFFVGSNFDSHGKWNPDDNDYLWNSLYAQGTHNEIENILLMQGVRRYKEMFPDKLVEHFINKLNVLYCDVGHATNRDFPSTFEKMPVLSRWLIWMTTCYYWLLIGLVFLIYSCKLKKRFLLKDDLLPVLTFIGFSMAYMLVEVMNRYASMPIALLILILGMGLSDALNDKVTQTNLPISKSALSDDSVD